MILHIPSISQHTLHSCWQKLDRGECVFCSGLKITFHQLGSGPQSLIAFPVFCRWITEYLADVDSLPKRFSLIILGAMTVEMIWPGMQFPTVHSAGNYWKLIWFDC